MKMQFRNGLLFTSLQITYGNSSKIIDNIVIDTGASETILSPDVVEDIGLVAELGDVVNSFYGVGGSKHNFFTKKVNSIQIGSAKLSNIKMDFGLVDPKGRINGLLGLDLLIEIGATIDLKNLSIKLAD